MILAPYAAGEVTSREKNFQAMVDAGDLTAEAAQADLTAWRAIAAMLRLQADDRPGNAINNLRRNPLMAIGEPLPWEALREAVEQARRRWTDRAQARADDEKAARRRDALVDVADWLAAEHAFWTGTKHKRAA